MVYTFAPHMEEVYPELMSDLRARFEVVAEFGGTLNHGTIYVWHAPPESSGRDGERRAG